MDQHTEYPHNDFMIPDHGFQFTPLPFHSPHQGIFPQLNLPHLEDKLNLEYNALLNPENKDSVITKIDQYNEAGRAFINIHQYQNNHIILPSNPINFQRKKEACIKISNTVMAFQFQSIVLEVKYLLRDDRMFLIGSNTKNKKAYENKWIEEILIENNIFDKQKLLQNRLKSQWDQFSFLKSYKKALKIYEQIVEAQPKNEKAAVIYAKCLQVNEEHHRAIYFFKYAMELNDKLKIENYTQAEQNFKHSVRVDFSFPMKYNVYLYLGIINKYNLQYKIAIDYFLMNLSDPSNQNPEKSSLVLINIGQCLECFQEYDEAASCYNKSLCLTPGNFTALKAISWLFFQNGKITESKDILMQALYINSDREVYYMQARCLEQLGKHKEAMQAISQAIQAEPNNPDNFTVLGVIFNKLNMHMEAFQSFQRAYQMDTSKIENLFNMALIYEVSKKYQDALKLYSKLLLLDPQDCIVLQRKACIESSNYQNLTEYQFQMRFPAFKPSAQLWWIENQKISRFNILHEISGISLYQNNPGQINEKIEHGVGSHSIFDVATKKASLLSQGNMKNENDELKSSASFSKSANNLNNHKNSISANFNNQFLQQNQFMRSRNSSFNCKADDNAENAGGNGQNGGNKNSGNNSNINKTSDIHNSSSLANRKDSSMDITALQRRQHNQQHRNKLFSTDQGFEGNDGHHAIYDSNIKKEENEQYSFSNSPKKEDKIRKESDLFYEQTRRNSMLSNFGGQFHQYQFGYSPFNGPAIPKDSIDFGYNIGNNYFQEQLDNGNPNDFGGNRQKKSSIIGHNLHSQYNVNKNINNKSDNQIYQ